MSVIPGLTVNMTPCMMAWFLDNTSMNGSDPNNSGNRGKNSNAISVNTIRATAQAFSVGVKTGTSTNIILCPASPKYATPTLFLQAYLGAIPSLKGDAQVLVGKEIEAACNSVLETSRISGKEPEWAETLEACFWNHSERPNPEFASATPVLISPQGQNRSAICTAVLAEQMGVPTSRGGRFYKYPLFEGEGADQQLDKLKASLTDPEALLTASLFNHLSYKEAGDLGRHTYKHEADSREPGLYAAIQLGKVFVQQVFSPEENICREQASEALGKEWASILKTPGASVPPGQDKMAKDLQKKAKAYVVSEFLSAFPDASNGLPFVTLLYACALQPEAFIVKVLLRRLLAEDEAHLVLDTPPADDGSGQENKEIQEGSTGRHKVDLSGRTKVQTLSSLFGLLEETQQRGDLVNQIMAFGASNKVNTHCKEIVGGEILRCMVRSVLLREHLEDGSRGRDGENAGEDVGDAKNIFLDAVPNLVPLGYCEQLKDKDVLRGAEDFAADLFIQVLGSKNSPVKAADRNSLSCVNRQAIKSAVGRLNSNKSDLYPGLGKRPFLSICNERVSFTRETCVEYENYRELKPKGGDARGAVRARRLSSELAAMAAERAISKLAQGDDDKFAKALEQFRLLLAAIDKEGILYGIVTSAEVEKLKIEGEPFFDSARMELLASRDEGLGDRDSQRGTSQVPPTEDASRGQQGGPGGDRAACNGHLDVEMSVVNGEDSTPLLVPLTTAQLKAFGLLGQDGTPDSQKQITLTCSVPQQRHDEEESDGDHGGEESANVEGSSSSSSLKRQKNGRADAARKHPAKRPRIPSITSTDALDDVDRDGAPESNYEDGGADFDEIPPRATPRQDPSPVADQVHFDQDSDSVTSVTEIHATLLRCKEHFHAQKDCMNTTKEAEKVACFLINNLSSAVFVNKDLAAAAARKLGSMSTAYVFVDGVLKVVKGKVMERHLAAPHTAKYIFSQGEAYGSLWHLVVGKYGTFPNACE